MAIDHQAYDIADQVSKVKRDQAIASALVRRARSMPERRELVLRNIPEGSATVALVYALVQAAQDQRRVDPRDSRRWASCACEIADRVQGPLAADARMAALTEMGNGFRITGDLAAAEEALSAAETYLERCSGDPVLLAELASVQASLAVQREQLASAARYLDVALDLAAEIGDRALSVRLLVQLAIVCEHTRDPAPGLDALEAATQLVDDDTSAMLRLTIVHSIVRLYKISGQPLRALGLIKQAGPIWMVYGTPLDRARAQWVYGQCLLEAGTLGDACAALSDAKVGIEMTSGSGVEVGLVALDLARALCADGRHGPARRAVLEALEALRGHGLSQAMEECLEVWTVVGGHEALAMVEVICREAQRRLRPHAAPSGY